MNEADLIRREDVMPAFEAASDKYNENKDGRWFRHHMADAIAAIPSAPSVAALVNTFYIDCEFDGHNGPLLSFAIVRGDGYGLHIRVLTDATDPWVLRNVVPRMPLHGAHECCAINVEDVGQRLRDFIGDCQTPTIIADSPVDIGRFCSAISTGTTGGWRSTDYPRITFRVENIDCYPNELEDAVQHNAWGDAMALRAALAAREGRGNE
jgi:hypothetical protein